MSWAFKQPLNRTASGANRNIRSGQAIMETAIALPILLFLAMGMGEYGQYFSIRNAFESGTRDACRFAIPATALQTDPTTAITRTLAQAGITFTSSMMTIVDDSNYNTLVTDVSTIPAGHGLTVSVSVNYTQLPIVYRPLNAMTGQGIKNGKMINCICTMVKE